MLFDFPVILDAVADYIIIWSWNMMYFWTGVVIYNIISALFNICLVRKLYIGFLRKIYRLFNGTQPSMPKHKSVRFDESVNGLVSNGNGVAGGLSRRKSNRSLKGEYQLADAIEFVQNGIDVIIEDDVTKCFKTENLEEWNFLTRTRFNYNMGLWMEILLVFSVIFRFSIFLVIRLPVGIASLLWLVVMMVLLSVIRFLFPNSGWTKYIESKCSIVCCRLLAASLCCVVNIHHSENRAHLGSVCVANHTTPIDVIILAVDNCFTLVGQRHGGILGVIQRACSLAQEHIWFERKIASDRRMVSDRLKQHIANPVNNPILIFPEGTCINNTSVFMFKKGCFELGATIYPVVIKYHKEFADPYWNSQEQSMITYLAMLMTSWAIVCDIDYLKPTKLKEGETATEFASRVKADICRKGGLVDLPWDGMIKRPGNENYLQKLIDDERKAFWQLLHVKDHPGHNSSDNEDGLIMIKHS